MIPRWLLACSSLAASVNAYSFFFADTPSQCGHTTLELNGTGTPPYTVLLVPYGDPPGGTEHRIITSKTFSGSSLTFNLPFPSNAQFLAMVSDSKRVGSGGTSIPINVQPSGNSSCLPGEVAPDFFLFVGTTTPITLNQCTPVSLGWSANATSPVTIYGVLPGGNSFSIDTSSATAQSDGSMSFNWTPDVPVGTDIILVAGDARGPGTGGSTTLLRIGAGSSSCLVGNYPSSTPGLAAGGVYPTGATSSGGSSSSDVGPIVGGVIGGLAAVIAILLIVFCFYRRLRENRRKSFYEKPDLLHEQGGQGGHTNGEPGFLPQGYEPEPFIIPTATSVTGSRHGSAYDLASLPPGAAAAAGGLRAPYSERAVSRTSGDFFDDADSSAPTSSNFPSRDRKNQYGPALRPVNIIQHDDAGEVPEGSGGGDEAEVVELPPSYNAVQSRRGQGAGTSS